MTAMLQMGLKDKSESLAQRERQVDQECPERKEIVVLMVTPEILVLSVTME